MHVMGKHNKRHIFENYITVTRINRRVYLPNLGVSNFDFLKLRAHSVCKPYMKNKISKLQDYVIINSSQTSLKVPYIGICKLKNRWNYMHRRTVALVSRDKHTTELTRSPPGAV